MTDSENTDYVRLPVATRDFIVQALRDTNQQLSKTHRLRATTHILVEEGVRMTKANSFTIDHRDHLLLMSLAERLLRGVRGDAAQEESGPRADAAPEISR